MSSLSVSVEQVKRPLQTICLYFNNLNEVRSTLKIADNIILDHPSFKHAFIQPRKDQI